MEMHKQEGLLTDAEMTSVQASEVDDWTNFRDNDIMQQQSAILAEEAEKIPFVGDKEPLLSLEAEYQSGSSILLEKIKVLSERYASIRRTRGDGNCFFRSFMFAYLEHILKSQDRAEVDRITANVEECRKTLQSLGYADFTFEDFFAVEIEIRTKVIGSMEHIKRNDSIDQVVGPSTKEQQDAEDTVDSAVLPLPRARELSSRFMSSDN
ncbi:unnamed protein product [Ilex paraguariensis]|uniref:ubiquitinyl hydrolase 1 n=1 Tax=Ilex paraguariensis TaxID=185542 RepID=A0ABC8U6L1_9AQUA